MLSLKLLGFDGSTRLHLSRVFRAVVLCGAVGLAVVFPADRMFAQSTDEKSAAEKATQDPALDEAAKARAAIEQKISDSIKAFDLSVRDSDETVRIDGIRRVLPNEELLVKMFGEADGKKLWEGLEPALKRMLTTTDKIREATLQQGTLIDVQVRNCRENDSEVQGFKEVFQIIPADIPVYNAAIKFEQNVVVVGSYVCVDDKVYWLRALEQYPKILKAGK